LFLSYDVIDSFFKWKPPIFFLDSDSPFNSLNASIKILLPYIRKFLRKKINLEKTQLVDNKQVYEEIPPVLVLSSFIPAPNQN
jgi:hypothetical protein